MKTEGILLVIVLIVALIILIVKTRKWILELADDEEIKEPVYKTSDEILVKPKSFDKNKSLEVNDHVKSVTIIATDEELKPADLKAIGKSKASYNKRKARKPKE